MGDNKSPFYRFGDIRDPRPLPVRNRIGLGQPSEGLMIGVGGLPGSAMMLFKFLTA
jgi:hypothetical protein